ncbi:PREDICTED: dysbindin protein homolog [Nicrophorus vespilloides]|uniref:Dysbindin protein homolog n=1 Tax=Nicrophorus vespilloides TaxID=110193 RepID=A0ABM1MG80_NICVS|nr:PREDICTED: dysbindin protein homolog [Nicrophorus vespilloides]
MEVFNNIKDFLNAKHLLTQSGDTLNTIDGSCVDCEAGTQILQHFQQEWEDLHRKNEENAERAEQLAEIISETHRTITNKNAYITKINQLIGATPCLKDTVEQCARQISELHQLFEDVEKALVDFEDVIEEVELQHMKNEHRYQLALYQEKRIANLETCRLDLANKHAQRVSDIEHKNKRTLQERQQVFQEAFKNDLETYKILGAIPKIEAVKAQPSALLEEIQLDMDDTELNNFLDDK